MPPAGRALWQRDGKVGKVPLRLRTEALAQAAADTERRAAEEMKSYIRAGLFRLAHRSPAWLAPWLIGLAVGKRPVKVTKKSK